MRPLRIAFITTEFPTETSGGLASYVHRMARILGNLGHVCEVFVPSRELPDDVLMFDGIRVHRIPFSVTLSWRAVAWLLRFGTRNGVDRTVWYLHLAREFGRAFKHRHRGVKFDFVQSCDFGMTGLFVSGKARHIVRCSGPTRVYDAAIGRRGFDTRLMTMFEAMSVRRADAAYAPSNFIAADYARHGMRVGVVRPPFVLECEPVPPQRSLPAHYLIHFGWIDSRKGSDVLAKALLMAWEAEPDLRMVWAGRETIRGAIDEYRSMWGAHAERVIWLGLVDKPELYGMVQSALATVIPSRFDNLPNSALESLLLRTPVIASNGASLDELIDDGENGFLVEAGDAAALARAMVRVWRNDVPWNGRGIRPPKLSVEMEPARAAEALLRFAGFGNPDQVEAVSFP